MNSPAATPSPEPVAGLSQASRLANVFFSPTTTFTDIKRNPSWWAAWLVVGVFSVLFAFSMQQKIGWEQVTRTSIESSRMQSEQWEKVPPDQRAAQMEIRTKATAAAWYGVPVLTLIFTIVFAALYLGVFNFGLGTEMSFQTTLSVVFHASLPEAIRWLLAAIALFAGASAEGFNPQNPVATNLGFLPGLNRLEHPVLYAAASSIDLFRIWSIILTGIGFSCVTKVKRSTAYAVAIAMYIVGIGIAVGLTALAS